MSRLDKVRTVPCSRADARVRLRQAEALVLVAEICLDDESDVATPGVAAALAVLAAIAASDAACCVKLGKRSRGQHHEEAVALVRGIHPDGHRMSKLLGDVLATKDDSHYGTVLVSDGKAQMLVKKARVLVQWAGGRLDE